jgi:hypothetical protein
MNIFKTDLIRQLSLLALVLLLVIANPDTTQADTAKILARNITGAAVAEDANNVEISAAIFSQEDADIILLSETRRAEGAIAGILDDGYTLAVLEAAASGMELTSAQQSQYIGYLFAMLKSVEVVYFQYAEGRLDKEYLDTRMAGLVNRNFLGNEFGRAFFEDNNREGRDHSRVCPDD